MECDIIRESLRDIIPCWNDNELDEATKTVKVIIRSYSSKNSEFEFNEFISEAIIGCINAFGRYGMSIVPENLVGYVKSSIRDNILKEKIKRHKAKKSTVDITYEEYVVVDEDTDSKYWKDSVFAEELLLQDLKSILTNKEFDLLESCVLHQNSMTIARHTICENLPVSTGYDYKNRVLDKVKTLYYPERHE